MTTTDQLAAIQARVGAASKGPWDHEPFDGSFGVYSLEMRDNGDFPAVIGYYASEGEGATEADAEFIAHARTDVPALLALVREQQAVIAKLSDWAGKNRVGYYDEAQDDVVQIIRAALTAKEATK